MLVAELTQLLELARTLAEHLDPSQIELCRALSSEITFSVEKAICTASAGFFNGGEQHVEKLNLNQEFGGKEQKISKKRRILPNRTNHVRVSTGAGAEVPPDDGHSWRKYGQKDILETHTCSNSLQQTASKTHLHDPQQSFLDQHNSLVLHLDFQTNPKVKTESSESENQDLTSSFCLISPRLSSAFMSPTTSGSNCFPRPDCGMSSQADPDLAEIISGPTSVTDSSVMNAEFMLEYGQMYTDIPFDTSIFFVSDPSEAVIAITEEIGMVRSDAAEAEKKSERKKIPHFPASLQEKTRIKH